jgi:hypothetical protein
VATLVVQVNKAANGTVSFTPVGTEFFDYGRTQLAGVTVINHIRDHDVGRICRSHGRHTAWFREPPRQVHLVQ